MDACNITTKFQNGCYRPFIGCSEFHACSLRLGEQTFDLQMVLQVTLPMYKSCAKF